MKKKVKQIIVIRKDLNMRKGKMIAQGSHASIGAFLKFFDKNSNNNTYSYSCTFETDSVLDGWLNDKFTKICLYVNSEDELVSLYEKVTNEAPYIPCVMIEDAGLTEFHGVKTKTCIGIGPFWEDEINKFTQTLPLL